MIRLRSCFPKDKEHTISWVQASHLRKGERYAIDDKFDSSGLLKFKVKLELRAIGGQRWSPEGSTVAVDAPFIMCKTSLNSWTVAVRIETDLRTCEISRRDLR